MRHGKSLPCFQLQKYALHTRAIPQHYLLKNGFSEGLKLFNSVVLKASFSERAGTKTQLPHTLSSQVLWEIKCQIWGGGGDGGHDVNGHWCMLMQLHSSTNIGGQIIGR